MYNPMIPYCGKHHRRMSGDCIIGWYCPDCRDEKLKHTMIINEPSSELIGSRYAYSPGTKIELSDDKSLVEISHFYHGRDITQVVGFSTDEIDNVISYLKQLKEQI